ncbi:MAG: hypothetical protein M1833_005804 [Piccolia ochrophora]|nr:MAG: hypothetical protein M1833_005804 [Piccolia ochrophora]
MDDTPFRFRRSGDSRGYLDISDPLQPFLQSAYNHIRVVPNSYPVHYSSTEAEVESVSGHWTEGSPASSGDPGASQAVRPPGLAAAMGHRKQFSFSGKPRAEGERHARKRYDDVGEEPPQPKPFPLEAFTYARPKSRNKGTKAFRPLALSDLPSHSTSSSSTGESGDELFKTEITEPDEMDTPVTSIDKGKRRMTEGRPHPLRENVLATELSPKSAAARTEAQFDIEEFPQYDNAEPDDPTTLEDLTLSPKPRRAKPSPLNPVTTRDRRHEFFSNIGAQFQRLDDPFVSESNNAIAENHDNDSDGPASRPVFSAEQHAQLQKVVRELEHHIIKSRSNGPNQQSQDEHVTPCQKPNVVPRSSSNPREPDRKSLKKRLYGLAQEGIVRSQSARSLVHDTLTRPLTKTYDLRRDSATLLPEDEPPTLPDSTPFPVRDANHPMVGYSSPVPWTDRPIKLGPEFKSLMDDEVRLISEHYVYQNELILPTMDIERREKQQNVADHEAEMWWVEDGRNQHETRLYVDQIADRELDPTTREAHEADPRFTGTIFPASDISNRLLGQTLGTLHGYVFTPPTQGDCFASYAHVPEWCVDTTIAGLQSFFGEDWGPPPARVGRDPRYRPVMHDPRFTVYEETAAENSWRNQGVGFNRRIR